MHFCEYAVFRSYLIAGTHCAFLSILSATQTNKLDLYLHKTFWRDYGSYKTYFDNVFLRKRTYVHPLQ